ncbi:PcfJ domain-containing protein [Rhodohalobacter mucosus]|uniref:PcfJ-like protein n=1 Tax=Rhodohalobacter mucosus TaxID=2079485 RepID=A0A316TVA0_9BACT|nr:PcfJ domain-containing protein [Rhodohalobacter mucosus]PWN06372.1 hypothetical protein DDZ15_11160 [Rhodohalobacter mucosus]
MLEKLNNNHLVEYLAKIEPKVSGDTTLDLFMNQQRQPKISSDNLGIKLFEHFYDIKNMMLSYDHRSKEMINTLKFLLGDDKIISKNFISNIILFLPFLRRKNICVDHNNPHYILEQIVVKYKPPAFLYSVWDQPLDVRNVKWLIWFVCLSQGASLKKVSKLFNWSYPVKLQKHLYHVPAHYDTYYGVLFAWIMYKSGSIRDATLIVDYPFFSHGIDLTEPKENDTFISYWHSFINWLLKQSSKLTDAELYSLLHFSEIIYKNESQVSRGNITWKGRSAKKMIEEYQRLLMNCDYKHPYLHWEKRFKSWFTETNDGDVWSIEEIDSSLQLKEEGEIMQHCVFDHLNEVLNDQISVFSLTRNKVKQITISYSLDHFDILQIRGKRNRAPNKKEKQIIGLWLEQLNSN